MSQASEPIAGVSGVAFELDRFQLMDDDLCLVEGRWFGVRGRRFMRPALTVTVDGQERRLLADLAGKPWAAEDGERWSASFPVAVESDELLGAELTVAPDITISLSESGAGGGAEDLKGEDRRRAKRPRRPSQRSAKSTVSRERTSAREPTDANSERRRFAHELNRLEAEKAQVAARTDALLGQLSDVAGERDDAQATRDELAARLEALQSERDQLSGERAAADLARDEAIHAGEDSRDALARAEADRDAALAAGSRAEADLGAATAARDDAISERDRALSERDAAIAARDQAVSQREAVARTNERLQAELADVMSGRGAALVMRRAAQEPSAFPRHRAVPARAVAIIAMLVSAVVLLLILRVI